MYREPEYERAQELTLELFRDTVHYTSRDNRWWSRDPETGRWINDRGVGLRFRFLVQVAASIRRPSESISRTERLLSSPQGWYTFLRALRLRMLDLPEPADFRTHRG